jgi:hypothetical protein
MHQSTNLTPGPDQIRTSHQSPNGARLERGRAPERERRRVAPGSVPEEVWSPVGATGAQIQKRASKENPSSFIEVIIISVRILERLMPRLQRSRSLTEFHQGRRALKNGHLPLAFLVRAFSALLESCDQRAPY